MLEDPFMFSATKGLRNVEELLNKNAWFFYITEIISIYCTVEMRAANFRNSVSLSTRTDCLLWKVQK
jgi:hypothetical protein